MNPTQHPTLAPESASPRTQLIIDCLQVMVNADNSEQSIAYREEAYRQIETLESELSTAESALREAKEDTARLDWLEKNARIEAKNVSAIKHKHLREAIDAARQSDGKEKE